MVSAPAAGTTGQCGNISWGTAPVCKHIYILFILLTFHESSLSLSLHFLLPPLDQFLLTNDALMLTFRYSLYLTTDLKCWDDWRQAHKHNQHCCVQHCTVVAEGETCDAASRQCFGAVRGMAKYTFLPLECIPPCTGALILSCLLSIVSVARKPQVHAPGYFMLLRWLDTNDTRLSHFIVWIWLWWPAAAAAARTAREKFIR